MKRANLLPNEIAHVAYLTIFCPNNHVYDVPGPDDMRSHGLCDDPRCPRVPLSLFPDRR